MLKTVLIYFLSVLFFLAILPAAIIASGLFLDNLLSFPQIVYLPYNLILALIFITFGAFWMIWSVWAIVFIGKGNPQEGFGMEFLPASKNLVIFGPYRYTRNPMGFGCLMYIVGIGIYFGSIAALLIVMPIFIFLVAIYLKYFEEKNLAKRFGVDYLRYRENIPLFIPGTIKKRAP